MMCSTVDTTKISSLFNDPKFPLGKVVLTQGILNLIIKEGLLPEDYINRHSQCDWSDMSDDDQLSNADALDDGLRIFSSYKLDKGIYSADSVWVITEHDRSVTTILLPMEY
ncbi:MAG: hypothetical protein QM500_18165 [Methylococcales bacterium]